MVTDAQIIAEARTWIGTPFVHQAALKGVGCDCVGLIRGVADGLHMNYDRTLWRRFANYARLPNSRRMEEGLSLFLAPLAPDEVDTGDVMFFEWRANLPMHLAIFARGRERDTMVHALAEAGKVTEHGFGPPWPNRLVSCWRYPERSA